jgi:hypothetical protein
MRQGFSPTVSAEDAQPVLGGVFRQGRGPVEEINYVNVVSSLIICHEFFNKASASGLKPLADNNEALRAKSFEPIGLEWKRAGLQPNGESQALILFLNQ